MYAPAIFPDALTNSAKVPVPNLVPAPGALKLVIVPEDVREKPWTLPAASARASNRLASAAAAGSLTHAPDLSAPANCDEI